MTITGRYLLSPMSVQTALNAVFRALLMENVGAGRITLPAPTATTLTAL